LNSHRSFRQHDPLCGGRAPLESGREWRERCVESTIRIESKR